MSVLEDTDRDIGKINFLTLRTEGESFVFYGKVVIFVLFRSI